MKFRFNCTATVAPEQQRRNQIAAKARGLPAPQNMKRPPLAIVGGGPSAIRKLSVLKSWTGDIWACGSAYPWVHEQGIEATFFNVDSLPEQAKYAKGAKHAILASISDPSVFDAVEIVECFDLRVSEDYTNHGVSAAMATPVLALEMGYTAVVYFGCESSFDVTRYAYEHDNDHTTGMGCWVQVGDEVFPTNPQLLMQAEPLSAIIRTCPRVFAEASGGLLRALIKNEHYEIVAVNNAMHEKVDVFSNGERVSRERAREILPVLDMAI